VNAELPRDHTRKFLEVKALLSAIEGLVSWAINVASKRPRCNGEPLARLPGE
jgi:hypothetical protein